MVSKEMAQASNHKSLWLCLSVTFWMILCMGLLGTIYYGQYDVEVNIMIKNSNHSYLAAVVDYKGFYFPNNYQEATVMNLYQYVQIIEQTARYFVDIIVFPECGLFMCGYFSRDVLLQNAVSVPSTEEIATPCENYIEYDDVISKLSCAAKAGKIYVAVDVWEKFIPINGSDDDVLLFNTEVVFDRQGTIIARYRKYNLFVEKWINGVNKTKNVDLVTFETDFNETFGIIICFDLLFKDPAVTLVKEKQATSMIYSASWNAVLPFFASRSNYKFSYLRKEASSVEAGWSYAMNVNLLASSLPFNASFGGSNIYFGRNEHLGTHLMDYGFSKIIIGAVPKNGAKCIDGDILETALPKYSVYGTKETVFASDDVLNSTAVKSLFNISPNESEPTSMDLHKNSFHYVGASFDCSVSVVWKNNNVTIEPNYKMIGYSGTDSFTIASMNNYVEMCGLIMCSREQNEYCEMPPEFEDTSRITILSVNIVAVSRRNTAVTIPITLTDELLSLNAAKLSFSSFQTIADGSELNVVEMNLRQPTDNLITFSVVTLPQKSNSSKIVNPPSQLLVL